MGMTITTYKIKKLSDKLYAILITVEFAGALKKEKLLKYTTLIILITIYPNLF